MQTNPIKNVSKDKKREKKAKDQNLKSKPEPISNWEAEGGALLPEDIPFVPGPGVKEDKLSPEKKENNEGNGGRKK